MSVDLAVFSKRNIFVGNFTDSKRTKRDFIRFGRKNDHALARSSSLLNCQPNSKNTRIDISDKFGRLDGRFESSVVSGGERITFRDERRTFGSLCKSLPTWYGNNNERPRVLQAPRGI